MVAHGIGRRPNQHGHSSRYGRRRDKAKRKATAGCFLIVGHLFIELLDIPLQFSTTFQYEYLFRRDLESLFQEDEREVLVEMGA